MSAVNDGRCSPWVMCSCSVVSGNQIRDNWLPVSFRIQFKILLIVFKALNGQAPSYISDLISFKSTSKPFRSANKALLYVPRSRLKFKGDRAFAVAAPRLWNQLPPDIKSAPSISVFKSRLKTHLYSMAFPEFLFVD